METSGFDVHGYVLERMNIGEDREILIQHLTERGLTQAEAEQAIHDVEAQLSKSVTEKPNRTSHVIAVVAAILSAVIGAVLWAYITVITEYEIGIVAWALGGFCGGAIYYATKRKKGLSLQLIAAVVSCIGIVLGKYLSTVYFSQQFLDSFSADITVNYFDINVFTSFFQGWISAIGWYDILWICLAIGTAWKILQPSSLRVPLHSGGSSVTNHSE